MSKVSSTKKEIFTVLGEVKEVEGVRRFVPASSSYVLDRFSRIPIGKKLFCTFFEKTMTLSDAQRDYHFVLMHYLAEHTGYTKNEMHDAAMREKWGAKKVKFMGKLTEVRESIADIARFPKWKMVEQIEFDLKACAFYEIKLPTMRELGFLVDENDKIIK